MKKLYTRYFYYYLILFKKKNYFHSNQNSLKMAKFQYHPERIAIFAAMLALLLLLVYQIMLSRSPSKYQLMYPRTEEERLARIARFKANHERIVRNPGTPPGNKFVYVVPSINGYGNKLIAVVDAFAIALLTNSAVIIDMAEIDRYISEPMYMCLVREKNSSTANNELSYLYEPNRTYMMPAKTKVSLKRVKNLRDMYLNIPDHDRIALPGLGVSLYYELACNRKYFDTFVYYGLVRPDTVHSALAVLDSLSSNETTMSSTTKDEDIDVLYRTGYELAHSILTTFWTPVAGIQEQVDAFVAAHFRGYFVIGLQLRYFFIWWNDTETFVQCAERIEASVVRGRRGRRADTELPVRWFVLSDDDEKLQRVKSMYPGKVIHAEGLIAHVSEESADGYSRAMLDLELLARCDEMVLTGGSTFGFAGSLRSGRYPWFVNGRQEAKNATRECQKFRFSEPGFANLEYTHHYGSFYLI
jgi:hypothetical protein